MGTVSGVGADTEGGAVGSDGAPSSGDRSVSSGTGSDYASAAPPPGRAGVSGRVPGR
jgi:hypothetical protein